MNREIRFLGLLLFISLLLNTGCQNNSSNKYDNGDTTLATEDSIYSDDTGRHYVIDTTGMSGVFNEYEKVKNLLEFHTKDTMKTDSTYLATLSMGKDISSFELGKKVQDIVEPGGIVKVRDTTQEISMFMEATLQDKASKTNPNFLIELVGSESNRRKYDEKKNKMVWQWNVTPKKEGNHELILSISHVDEDGHELGSPETRRHTITIFSSKRKGGFGNGFVNFLDKYWQWLLGAIALPIFIAWFTTKRRNAMKAAEPGIAKDSRGGLQRKKRRR